MASTPIINNPISLSLLTLLLLLSLSSLSFSSTPTTPTPWPHQFHSLLFMNRSGTLQALDLWYDWPNGRNFNIIQNQLGTLTYDLEWNNGTSFVYTLDSSRECRVLALEVGILRPDWLDGANYLGQRYMDGFLCNVWEKVEFIWYYEDVISKRPVFWVFYSGYSAHVMTFEVGRVLEDARWQAPVYCFEETGEKKSPLIEYVVNVGLHGRLMRGVMNTTSSL
ncbi:uncharacterized protein At4g14100-like [Rhododendron vialii]|uniref:uncharacterized protein At4g14100-like n=1 Tax=Rhododendron vialii TaxID=182163 RepID=UPI00265F0805|nr:uncharacterized protein At4g14100-like [Rhododendron vialii]